MKNIKIKKFSKFAILLVSILLVYGSTSYAVEMETPSVKLEAGLTPMNGMMQTNKETIGYESPNMDSDIIVEVEKGKSVIVVGKTEDGWYQVVYQGQTMYMQENSVEEVLNEELAEEISELEKFRMEEAEWDIKTRKEVFRSRVWGAIIVTLIVGIFAAGMVSVIRADKEVKK